ncbi:MAG: hypothetical protein ABUL44_04150, partial [Flavobacterium sp.]
REAQIQLALERIRASAMAMKSSKDLFSVADTLRIQLSGLGRKELESSIIHFYPENSDVFEVWYSFYSEEAKRHINDHGFCARSVCSWSITMMDKYFSDEQAYTIESRGDMLADWYKVLEEFAPATVEHDANGKIIVPEILYYHFSKFSGGALLMISDERPADEACNLQLRAAKVFELAFQRYNDLEKAEAQTRESQIEVSLERVRAKTMAMHNSQDVGDTVATMFDEVGKLGIQTIRCGIGIMHPGGEMELWTAKPDENGKADLVIGQMDMMMHPLLKGAYTSWQNKKEFYTYDLIGDDLIAYYTAINNHPDYPVKYDIASLPSEIIHSEFHFAEGTLFVFSLEKLSAEA